MSRLLYDGGFTHIPAWAKFVVVGSPAEAAKRPGDQALTLDHNARNPDYDVLDFERLYVNNPRTAVRWARQHNARGGAKATIYANPANYDRIRRAGLQPSEFDWWVPDQTGSPHAYQPRPGQQRPVATQWYGKRQPGWSHYDISLVTDDAWHPSAGTIPPPPPQPGGGGPPPPPGTGPPAPGGGAPAPAPGGPPGGGLTVVQPGTGDGAQPAAGQHSVLAAAVITAILAAAWWFGVHKKG